MAVYYIISYNIDKLQEFEKYPPLAVALINQYGGEVLVSDTDSLAVEGEAKDMNAIVKFPSMEAALNCYNDPEYKEIKKIRINSTSDCTMILAKPQL